MIGYISGLIIDKDEKTLLVLTQGVGYQIFVNTELLSSSKIDQKAHLYIHTAVREDNISLYGFSGKEELTFFHQLISVSGIGPKMALDILSAPIAITQNAIIQEDFAMLTKIKGLGKKTAERLCVELKSKVVPVSLQATGKKAQSVNEEALMALASLGYEKFEIIKFLGAVPKELKEAEDIIKLFLKES